MNITLQTAATLIKLTENRKKLARLSSKFAKSLYQHLESQPINTLYHLCNIVSKTDNLSALTLSHRIHWQEYR